MHIIIAPNAFKNSLTAQQAASAISEGLSNSSISCTKELFPIADGGDGTGDLIIQKCQGTIITVKVNDPLGRKIDATFGLIDNGKTAVIEMASASGLRLLKPGEPDPLKASSYGTGEMIKAALNAGVNKIILAMGGSATVDGGCGILSALGVRFLDINRNVLPAYPEHLAQMSAIDASNMDARITGSEIIVLCDVDNLLLGDKGAAAVFGPQKGASPASVKQLDSFLSHFSTITLKQYGKDISTVKYGGAAGGATAGIYGFLNAKLVNGIEYFLKLTGFEAALKKCDFVITGEGSIDVQTLNGKGPFGVAYLAKQRNIPVIGVAGSVPLVEDVELKKYFNVLLAIGNEPTDLAAAINQTSENLIRTGTIIGNLLSL
jgi:glycerate kinase